MHVVFVVALNLKLSEFSSQYVSIQKRLCLWDIFTFGIFTGIPKLHIQIWSRLLLLLHKTITTKTQQSSSFALLIIPQTLGLVNKNVDKF